MKYVDRYNRLQYVFEKQKKYRTYRMRGAYQCFY